MDKDKSQPISSHTSTSTTKLFRRLLLVIPRLLVDLMLRLCLSLHGWSFTIIHVVGELDAWLEEIAEGEVLDDPEW